MKEPKGFLKRNWKLICFIGGVLTITISAIGLFVLEPANVQNTYIKTVQVMDDPKIKHDPALSSRSSINVGEKKKESVNEKTGYYVEVKSKEPGFNSILANRLDGLVGLPNESRMKSAEMAAIVLTVIVDESHQPTSISRENISSDFHFSYVYKNQRTGRVFSNGGSIGLVGGDARGNQNKFADSLIKLITTQLQ